MATAVLRKSVTDLTRRKARAVFTVLTLAIAVASVGIFAAPSLMDRAMQQEVTANRAARRDPQHEAASADALRSWPRSAGCPTSTAAQARQPTSRRACGSARRRERRSSSAFPTSRASRSNVVAVDYGAPPGTRAVLTDTQNAKQGRVRRPPAGHAADRRRRRP